MEGEEWDPGSLGPAWGDHSPGLRSLTPGMNVIYIETQGRPKTEGLVPFLP